MTDPNDDLGKWILRDVLSLKEGELLTSEYLNELGIDSVRIDKTGPLDFEVNFSKTGSFENFIKHGVVSNK
ncbi:MAG: hypothetical protein KAH01_00800 [Caldisericia bacterium]|nr:hypothetical protein [Caldisericia bacterium]